jgi:hypothetical protein
MTTGVACAVGGDPCPVGTKIIKCLEKLGVMTVYDVEACFDAFRADLKGFAPLKQKTPRPSSNSRTGSRTPK